MTDGAHRPGPGPDVEGEAVLTRRRWVLAPGGRGRPLHRGRAEGSSISNPGPGIRRLRAAIAGLRPAAGGTGCPGRSEAVLAMPRRLPCSCGGCGRCHRQHLEWQGR